MANLLRNRHLGMRREVTRDNEVLFMDLETGS